MRPSRNRRHLYRVGVCLLLIGCSREDSECLAKIGRMTADRAKTVRDSEAAAKLRRGLPGGERAESP